MVGFYIQFLGIKFWKIEFSGDFVDRVTPVPIPNTEVKPVRADGTAWEAVWESRKLPDIITKSPSMNLDGLFQYSKFAELPKFKEFYKVYKFPDSARLAATINGQRRMVNEKSAGGAVTN